jgi:hypothetical protein
MPRHRAYGRIMAADWWTIEVFDGDVPAATWRDARQQALIESALTNGALSWEWRQHSWGVLFEVSFADEEQWEKWRDLPGTRAALDAVPDPVNGLVVYRGRGGSSGSGVPRRPRPAPGAAAVELPEADERGEVFDLRDTGPSGEPWPAGHDPAVPA